jgi:hypothetical protein
VAGIGDRDDIVEASKVHGRKIGHADHLSRDNRLDLSGVEAYRQANEMAVTFKRHMRRL